MKYFKFTVLLGGVEYVTSELCDKLFKEGASDALLSQIGNKITLDYHREADSLGNAIITVIDELENVILTDGTEIEVQNISIKHTEEI